MSHVEIVKAGRKLGEIDDLAGTINITEEWKDILKRRSDEPDDEDPEEDDDGEDD